jgi:Asp/Glu/hydantoin racemase
MPKLLAFIHSISLSIELFNELSDEILPDDVEIFHIADEVLQKVVLAQGGLNSFLYRRMVEHVVSAEHAGANLILLTCSSVSPCVDLAKSMVSIPVFKIDVPMVDKALSIGKRIGIAATAPTTLKPTTELVQARAHNLGKVVEITSLLCEGAYDALFRFGDVERHDQIVRQTLNNLVARNDVVLLAQASMASVARTISVSKQEVPILSSPRLALEKVRDFFGDQADGGAL